MWKKQVTQITKGKQRIQIFDDYGLMPKHKASHEPFCLTDDFQVTVPSCSSIRSPWIRSSLRNSWPSFSRTTDFGSRRKLISLSRAAFSYSLTRSFTWEMASLISSRPCTRDLSSSVSAATRHRGRDVVKQQLLHSCISEGSQSVLVVWRLRLNWAFCTRGNQTCQGCKINSTFYLFMHSAGKFEAAGHSARSWCFTVCVLDDSLHQDGIFCDALSHQEKTLGDSQPSHQC